MRRILTLATVLTLMLASLVAFADEPPLFISTDGFATKTGFRGVFTWKAAQPVTALVHYGTSATELDLSVRAVPGAPDTAGLAITDGLTIGTTYYYQVEDLLTGESSEVGSFVAANAYKAWDAGAGTYTLNLLVQLDAQSLPQDVQHDMALADIAQGISIFAERLYDAMDGYVRLGKVVVTDTNLDYATNIPNTPTVAISGLPCANGNFADVIVQTSVPFDSHTYSGWAISNPCISFYVGRIGQLVVPWGDTTGGAEDLHFGYVSTHEMMHYAFNAPDLYSTADLADPRNSGCWNLDWDGSVMHNSGGWAGTRWELTELDRKPTVTPCDHQHSNKWTWQELRLRYDEIPLESENSPPQHIIDTAARGNEDGGALEISILDREPALSTLTGFLPSDINPGFECTADGPVLQDDAGDAIALLGTDTPLPNEGNLDIIEGRVDWDEVTGDTTFTLTLSDLKPEPPLGSVGELFDFEFTFAGKEYDIVMERHLVEGETFSLAHFAPTRTTLQSLEGAYDFDANTITAVLPDDAIANAIPGAPVVVEGQVFDSFSITSRRNQHVLVPDADTALGSCPYTFGLGAIPGPPPPPPPPPPPDGTISLTDPIHEWDGETTTDSYFVLGCSGLTEQTCDNERIEITVPEGSTDTVLDVTISTEDFEDVNDFDFDIFDPNGQDVGGSGTEGTPPEHDAIVVTLSGVYRIEVRAWATVEAAYHGRAELKSGDAPPPPDPGEFDGEISLGESYGWEGDPPVDGQVVFTCASLVMDLCDNEYIKVNVPVGGAKLNVKITANSAGDDFDVCVYDPDDVQSCSFAAGNEDFTLNVTKSGVYRIGVTAAPALGTYSGLATLNPP